MAKELGVAAVQGSSFFKEDINNLIRFHFAKKEETLKEAGTRLLKLRGLVKYFKKILDIFLKCCILDNVDRIYRVKK